MTEKRISLGLLNPKSPTNVGAILRASGCFGVTEVFYTGVRYARAAQFQTDTQNRIESIPLHGVEDLLSCKPAGSKTVVVELALGATALPEFSHPENAFYIFGPEDGTVDQHIIDAADEVIYIPTLACLNLAASVNIVLYDRNCKLPVVAPGDDLITHSRDTNNRVKRRNTP